jgi:hypothetical protein
LIYCEKTKALDKVFVCFPNPFFYFYKRTWSSSTAWSNKHYHKILISCCQLTCRELKFYSGFTFDVQLLCIQACFESELSNTQVTTSQLVALEQDFLVVKRIELVNFWLSNEDGSHWKSLCNL